MNTRIQDNAHQDLPLDPKHRRWRLALVLTLGALTLTGLMYGFSSLSRTFSADRVLDRETLRLATVQRGDLVREVMAQGRVVVANSPTLFSPEQGFVDLQVRAGDKVNDGQLLARISSAGLQESLARERARLTRLQADLAQQKIEARQRHLALKQALAMAGVQLQAMEREKRRADQAFSMKIISELDYEETGDDLERAQLEYEQAEQDLALSEDAMTFYDQSLELQSASQQMVVQALERRVEELNITSPVDGMVGNIQVNQKQAVAPNEPLITVVDLSAYEIEATVSEGLAGELAPAMDARIRLNGEDYPGVVTAISPEVVQGQVTVRIRFARDIPANLRQNQRLTARILLENRPDTLMVQRGPHFDNFRGYVFRLDGDRAHKTPVTLGGRSLSHIEISEGLREGDTLIISSLDLDSSDQTIVVTQ